ncbi:universal stress protein, partial [Rhodobacteraceae bacterium 2376]
LRRHGMSAHSVVRSSGVGGVSGALMDGCREFGADLMVMGAYEHSKFREDILGGVTQDILEGAHLPVLMSH